MVSIQGVSYDIENGHELVEILGDMKKCLK